MAEVDICNLALSMLGDTVRLPGTTVALLAGTTVQEQQCAIWYPQSRQWALRDYPWRFALRFSTMTLLATDDGTQTWSGRWKYQYLLPSATLYLRAVRFPGEDRKTSPPNQFELAGDSATGGVTVFTNVATKTTGGAIAEYMVDVPSTTAWTDPKFETALAGLLAFRLAPGLSADPQRAAQAWAIYQAEKLSAQRSDANEGESGEDVDGAFVTAHRSG